jgi:hypothetical protein
MGGRVKVFANERKAAVSPAAAKVINTAVKSGRLKGLIGKYARLLVSGCEINLAVLKGDDKKAALEAYRALESLGVVEIYEPDDEGGRRLKRVRLMRGCPAVCYEIRDLGG